MDVEDCTKQKENPNETTEVAYIAIVLNKQQEVLPRYFTLELHRPNDIEKQLFPERTSDKYGICEWDKDNKHYLYKSIDSSDPTLFTEELKKIINKQN